MIKKWKEGQKNFTLPVTQYPKPNPTKNSSKKDPKPVRNYTFDQTNLSYKTLISQ